MTKRVGFGLLFFVLACILWGCIPLLFHGMEDKGRVEIILWIAIRAILFGIIFLFINHIMKVMRRRKHMKANETP